jgi:hypothetical protein
MSTHVQVKVDGALVYVPSAWLRGFRNPGFRPVSEVDAARFYLAKYGGAQR